MQPKTKLATEAIERALKASGGFTEKEIAEVAFHLTDWVDDLKPFVEVLEAPEKFRDEDIHRIVVMLLLHAPGHLQIAAKKILHAAERGGPPKNRTS